MILDKLDRFKYKIYNDPVWLSFIYDREFYFGISLWLRIYKSYEQINGINTSCHETMILWVPFFKFTFEWEYEINPETNKPYQYKSPAQIYNEEFFKDLKTTK